MTDAAKVTLEVAEEIQKEAETTGATIHAIAEARGLNPKTVAQQVGRAMRKKVDPQAKAIAKHVVTRKERQEAARINDEAKEYFKIKDKVERELRVQIEGEIARRNFSDTNRAIVLALFDVKQELLRFRSVCDEAALGVGAAIMIVAQHEQAAKSKIESAK